MVNNCHALVSLLMIKKPNSKYNARDNVRLFMSMAHYAHQHFGNVLDLDDEANQAKKITQ